MKKKQKYVALIVLLAFLFTLYPGQPTYAWSDSGLSCSKGQKVNISNFVPSTGYYIGVWNVQISGAVSGSGKAVYINTQPSSGGGGYNFINSSDYSSAAREMNGEPSFVLREIGKYESTISWSSGSQRRTYIRYFAPLCGATVTGFNQGVVYVQTTPKPNALISPSSTIKAGEQTRITISGTSFTPSGSPSGITYRFYVDSSLVDSGSGSKSFSKQVPYTFPTAKNYTLRLEVTDGVGRTTTATKTVSVKSAAIPPPPPSGGNMPPVADFYLPYSAEVNESVNVQDRSVDYDGYIVSRDWSVSPSSYTGTLSGSGGTLRFTQKGTYTVRLTVTDNKGATDRCTKYISIGEPPPPPPPPEPPEPENIPPVARLSAPMECSPGEIVNVRNLSYDPDGYIEDVDWRITPSDGVAEQNLTDSGGTVVFDKLGTYTIRVTVTDDRGDSDSAEKEIDVVNKPPRARIIAPDSLMQGGDVTIRSSSSDPDGEIVKITWSVTPAEYMVGELSGEESTVYFDKKGEYKITLTVEDNWGATDTDELTISVEPAIPQAFFKDEGAYKQNRMIVLTEEGQSPSRYPIVKEQNKWEIVPVGDGATADAIRVKDVSFDKKEVLFKIPGAYKVRLQVTNTAGHASEWYERTLDILPDESPVADFVVQQAYLRELENDKKATIELRDTSYSPDGDIITHRTWKYRYDSNNDGNFEDEQWIVFSDGNDLAPSFQTDQVGKYLIELEVVEEFGEETIAEFVTQEERMRNDTELKPQEEKIAQVINVRPSVGFEAQPVHKVDVVIAEGAKQQVWEFSYTGTPQTVTLGPGTYLFEAWGAQGGGGDPNDLTKGSRAGKGGYTKGVITLTATNTFYVYVGGEGSPHSVGGYNGGGSSLRKREDAPIWGNSGGGATDFRLVGGSPDNINGLRSRIMVAGGGGGSDDYTADYAGEPYGTNDGTGGDGGGLTGGYGLANGIPSIGGGTQNGTANSAGYECGSFGKGGEAAITADGGGGGGGYYGGNGSDHNNSGGGGGSSFISGHPGCNAVNASGIHTGQPDHYSGLVFTDTVMESGVRLGNGFAKITRLDADDYNLNTVRQVLEGQLNASGLDATVTYCNTLILDSNAADANTIFDQWTVFPSNYGEWRLDPVNKVLYTPEEVNPPFETGFYDPNSFNTRDFSIEAMIKANQPSQPMGFIFKLSPKGGDRYKLYFLWLSSDSLQSTKSCLTLFKADDFYFNYKNSATPLAIYLDNGVYKYGWPNHSPYDYGGFPHGTPMQKGLTVSNKWDPTIKTTIMDYYMMPYISKTAWYKLKVEVSGNLISVYWNDVKVMTVYDPDMIPMGAYGFFQYSHVIPNFKDIVITTQSMKTLDEVVKAHTWRENAHKFVIDVNSADYSQIYLNDSTKCGELFSRLLSNQVDFSVLGTEANQASALQMIALNDNQGAFFLQTTDNIDPIQDYGNYIINKVLGQNKLENYFLLNEEVYYKTYYNDPEEDPKCAEQWKYNHDPNYFENSLGLASFHEQWLPAPVYRFDKVGEFKTVFQARDNPKDDDRFDEYRLWSYMPVENLHIYVHRRPIALFGVQLVKNGNDYNVIINSDAYDLDHISEPNKGIVEHKWSWRPATSATWNTGNPTTLAGNSDYLIKYKVKDLEGVWSYPEAKLVSTRNTNIAPVAQFTATPNPVVVNKPLTINDLSYDPNGDPIVQRQWRVKSPTGAWESATSSPPAHFSAIGEWEIELKVSDGSLWSEPFYQTVQVIPDNTAPVARFTVEPNPVYDVDPVTYNDTSYDPDGDPIVAREWRIRKDGGPWQYFTNPPVRFETVGGEGIYDIELRVQDQPRLPQLESKWSEWYKQTLTVRDSFKVVGSITPNPAERGRNITVQASALRVSNNQPIEIDQMEVIIPFDATGVTPHRAWMDYDPVNKIWHYTYTIPELSTRGIWPDDGNYLVKVIGYRSSTAKEDIIPLQIKGHIKRRIIIRTISW